MSNLFKRETLSGDFLQVNRYLADELKSLGLWTPEVRDQIKLAEGSIQGIAAIPERLRQIYRTVWELPQKAADRPGRRPRRLHRPEPVAEPVHGEPEHRRSFSSMYMYAWKAGIKTTYYLRSRPATKIAKATVSAGKAAAMPGRAGSGQCGGVLLAGEPGVLRGLPVELSHPSAAGIQ